MDLAANDNNFTLNITCFGIIKKNRAQGFKKRINFIILW